jgi:formylglycine-generating enzyme required for sulfatase activity
MSEPNPTPTPPRRSRPRPTVLTVVALGLAVLLAWSLFRSKSEKSSLVSPPAPVSATPPPVSAVAPTEAAPDDAAQLAAAFGRFAEREAALQEEIRTIRELAARLGLDRDSSQPSPSPPPVAASPMIEAAIAAPPDTALLPVEPVVPMAGAAEDKPGVFINSLGMRFVSVAPARVRMAIWPVRVRDFAAFAESTGHQASLWKNPGFEQGPDHPVVNVSWEDATAFCRWLTARERNERLISQKQTYRLPTDLEWSRAVGLDDESGATPEARDLGVAGVYPWGRDWPPPAGAGNYTGEETGSDEAIRGYQDGFQWTSPVGSFSPNVHGLYDMGGNVWEWCFDLWNAESSARVLRGASWYNGALKLSLLSSCRIYAAPESTSDNHGFRVVLDGG